jgi:Fic family protein
VRIEDFTENRSGRLIKSQRGYWAFIPNPLPPKLRLDIGLVRHLSEADRAIGQLAGRSRDLPNPHLLINPFIRKEAVLSSKIEGTQASLSDLFHFEAMPSAEKSDSDVQEVVNYVKALEYSLARIQEFPISLRLLKEIHSRLMEGVRGGQITPGEFRTSQNWIGPPGCTLNEALFVPPPLPDMHDCLGDFEKFLHTNSDIPPLLRLAMIHYQFEAIHPFLDGNGRIGRLILVLLLCAEKILPKPFIYLSVFFEKHRSEYYRRLLEVSQNGAWNEWFRFFVDAVREQSADAFDHIQRLLELRKQYRTSLQTARTSALTLKLLDLVFSSPVVTGKTATNYLGVTPRTALKCIDRLVTQGVLRETTDRKRNRVYVATEVLRIIEAPTN